MQTQAISGLVPAFVTQWGLRTEAEKLNVFCVDTSGSFYLVEKTHSLASEHLVNTFSNLLPDCNAASVNLPLQSFENKQKIHDQFRGLRNWVAKTAPKSESFNWNKEKLCIERCCRAVKQLSTYSLFVTFASTCLQNSEKLFFILPDWRIAWTTFENPRIIEKFKSTLDILLSVSPQFLRIFSTKDLREKNQIQKLLCNLKNWAKQQESQIEKVPFSEELLHSARKFSALIETNYQCNLLSMFADECQDDSKAWLQISPDKTHLSWINRFHSADVDQTLKALILACRWTYSHSFDLSLKEHLHMQPRLETIYEWACEQKKIAKEVDSKSPLFKKSDLLANLCEVALKALNYNIFFTCATTAIKETKDVISCKTCTQKIERLVSACNSISDKDFFELDLMKKDHMMQLLEELKVWAEYKTEQFKPDDPALPSFKTAKKELYICIEKVQKKAALSSSILATFARETTFTKQNENKGKRLIIDKNQKLQWIKKESHDDVNKYYTSTINELNSLCSLSLYELPSLNLDDLKNLLLLKGKLSDKWRFNPKKHGKTLVVLFETLSTNLNKLEEGIHKSTFDQQLVELENLAIENLVSKQDFQNKAKTLKQKLLNIVYNSTQHNPFNSSSLFDQHYSSQVQQNSSSYCSSDEESDLGKNQTSNQQDSSEVQESSYSYCSSEEESVLDKNEKVNLDIAKTINYLECFNNHILYSIKYIKSEIEKYEPNLEKFKILSRLIDDFHETHHSKIEDWRCDKNPSVESLRKIQKFCSTFRKEIIANIEYNGSYLAKYFLDPSNITSYQGVKNYLIFCEKQIHTPSKIAFAISKFPSLLEEFMPHLDLKKPSPVNEDEKSESYEEMCQRYEEQKILHEVITKEFNSLCELVPSLKLNKKNNYETPLELEFIEQGFEGTIIVENPEALEIFFSWLKTRGENLRELLKCINILDNKLRKLFSGKPFSQ